MIRKLLDHAGVDNAILWSIFNKLLSVVKGPISLYFLIRYLNPISQGLWYTFGSLGALTIFAELGFLTIITQFVSHEYAFLNNVENKIEGSKENLNRFFGLIRFAIKFYSLVVPVGVFVLCIVGFFFFKDENTDIKTAWYFFSIVGGLNLLLSLFQSIYTGLNNVTQIQINTFICTLLGSIANWVMLIMHWDIWALVLGNLVGVLIASVFLYFSASSFWKQIINFKVENNYNFLKETLPLQAKYAVSWISAFFILYLLVPAAYKYTSKIQAGQLGMTIALISAMCGVANAWILTKIPTINMFVAKFDYLSLDKLFKKALVQSVVIQLVLSVFLIIGIYFLQIYFISYSIRFLSIPDVILLIIPQFTQLLIIFYSVYLRAHKEEPLMWIILLQSILIILAVFFILRLYDLRLFLYSLNIIYLFIALPLSYYVFKKKQTYYKLKTPLQNE